MIYFITLFVLFSHVFSQTTTDPTKVDCSVDGACAGQVKPDYICPVPAGSTTTTPVSPYVCSYVAPTSNTVGSSTGGCGWVLTSCPVTLPPKCDCGTPPPTAAQYLCDDGKTTANVVTCVTTDATSTTAASCKWVISSCPVPKTGYCPSVEMLAPTDANYATACPTAASGIAVAGTCTSDTDCPEITQRCCKNTCGQLSCQTTTDVIVRPGTCPKITTGTSTGPSTCDAPCVNDNPCSDGQKCCPNSCGGSICTDVTSTITTCSASDCGAVPNTFCAVICSVAADGTTTVSSLVCEPAPTATTDGTTSGTTTTNCQWTPKPCPDGPPITTNPGSCPVSKSTVDAVCDPTVTSTCKTDADCKTSGTKCCFNGCNLACVNAIPPDTCVVSGVQNSICLDKTTAEATASASGTATTTSVSTTDYCYYDCVQDYACSYDPTTSLCTRGGDFETCVTNCKTPPTTTPPPPVCAHKTSCDCLGDTANGCGWCQIKGWITDKTGASSPYVWGYCTPSSSTGTNTCSAPVSTGGSGGDFYAYAPSECTDNAAVDPTIKDTSSAFTDPTCKEGFSKINTGGVAEVDVQKTIDSTKYDVTIKRILKANAADNKGTVSIIVEINSNTNGYSLDDFCNTITAGVAKTLGIDTSKFKNCQMSPYSDTTGTTAKRAQLQASQGQYISTATVDPSTTPSGSSAGNLVPVWMMMLFAIFLFFRM